MVVAILIIESVIALFSEIIESGGIIRSSAVICRRNILFRIADKSAQTVDGKFIFASVIGIVVNTVDDHCNVVIFLYFDRRYIKTLCHLSADNRIKCLLRQLCAVVIQRYTCSVRP